MKFILSFVVLFFLCLQPAQAEEYPPLKTSEELLAGCPWYVNSFPWLFYQITNLQMRHFYETNEDWHGCAVQRLIESDSISNWDINHAASKLLNMNDPSWSFLFWTYLLEHRHDPDGAFPMADLLTDNKHPPYDPEKAKHLLRTDLVTRYHYLCVREHQDTWNFFQEDKEFYQKKIDKKQRSWFLSLCLKNNAELLKIAQHYLDKDYKYRSPLISHALLKYLTEERSYKPAESLYARVKQDIKN